MGRRGYAELEAKLGHAFRDPGLLREALTHPSASEGRAGDRSPGDYERLEFLGDRVLGLVVAAYLLDTFKEADAGRLARRYNSLVRGETLSAVADEIGLGAHLRLARSERDSGGAKKPAILANACEAVIGALYLDGGLDVAAGFIHRHWDARADQLIRAPMDAKTRLQERAQKDGHPVPEYRLVRQEGEAHEPRFTVEVLAAGIGSGTGEGGSKRAAEQAAAEALLATLESSHVVS